MKLIASLALSLVFAATALAEQTLLVGGTVINPADGKTVDNAVLLINADKIENVTTRKEARIPSGTKSIDCTGKFILPGYIDTHVHFFQSGDLFTRPDGVDLTSSRSYKDEVAWIRSHLDDTFARYLRSGITSVVDVGGPMWNFEVRKRANATAKAPRVAVAGPLISSVSRPQLDLGDPPIVKIDSPEQARGFVLQTCGAKTRPCQDLVHRRFSPTHS
jgi:cytosine/adenosine deaminase-related metal-dependent hydrolase